MPRRRRRRRRRPPSKSEASPEGGDHADNIPILASPRLFVIITAVYFTPVVAAVLPALPSQYSTVLCSTVLYSKVQYCTVQYFTVQYCTVKYSTVQYCNVCAEQCAPFYMPWPHFA